MTRWTTSGKSYQDLEFERSANRAYMGYLMGYLVEGDPVLTKLRKRNTAIGNRIRRMAQEQEARRG